MLVVKDLFSTAQNFPAESYASSKTLCALLVLGLTALSDEAGVTVIRLRRTTLGDRGLETLLFTASKTVDSEAP